MFAGTLTRNVETAAAQYTGMIHSTRFDIAIQLEARAKMSERSPDFDVTAVNKSGRKVRIGTAWNETGNTSGNPYISMQIDVGLGPFRVNAVQTKEARAAQSGAFEIIPLVSNGLMKSGSISGELTAMDADNAFTGYIANMMFDLEFMLIENSYKSEETHPDYRIEVSSPRGTPIRVGSAWMAKSSRTGNDYLSLLINTPDGDLRVNAVQNEEQRGGQTFSIIPFIDSDEQPQDQRLADFVEHQNRNRQHDQEAQGKLLAKRLLSHLRTFEFAAPFHCITVGKRDGFDLGADASECLIRGEIAAGTAEGGDCPLSVAPVNECLDKTGIEPFDKVGHGYIGPCPIGPHR